MILTAPDRAASVKVTVSSGGGSCSKTFSVLEPESEAGVIAYQYTYQPHVQGAGMRFDPITVQPATVSFQYVECLELPGPATNITGYFTNYSAESLAHAPTRDWIALTASNVWADNALFHDYPSPWTEGGFKWVIPVRGRVVNSTNQGSLPNRVQEFKITGVDGTSTVSKLGQTVTRTP